MALGAPAGQQGLEIGIGIGVVAAPVEQDQGEGPIPQLAVGGGRFDAADLEADAVA